MTRMDLGGIFDGSAILGTGGAGMIGSHLVERLVQLGADVTVADYLWRGRRANLVSNGTPLIDFEAKFLEVELRDYENS